MKIASQKIIQATLLSAVAALLHPSDVMASTSTIPMKDIITDSNNSDVVGALQPKVIHNVVQVASTGDVRLLASHYSHRSHS